jgi:hypothetical protein
MEAPAEGVELEVSTKVRIAFARKTIRRNRCFCILNANYSWWSFWFKSVYEGGVLEEVYIVLCTQVGSAYPPSLHHKVIQTPALLHLIGGSCYA